MKRNLIFLLASGCIGLMAQPTHANINFHDKVITLSGLSSKAVYDTLGANEKLEQFFDCAMGKCYLETGPIRCVKNVAENEEELSCSFRPLDNSHGALVVLSSKVDGVTELASIRYALVEASKAERKVSPTQKELKIKSLSCAAIGVNHVLDSFEVEAVYRCKLSL